MGIIRRRAGCHEVPAEGINCVLLSRRGALMCGLIISRASYVGNTVMSILSTKETRCRVKLTSWMINVGASTIGLLTTKSAGASLSVHDDVGHHECCARMDGLLDCPYSQCIYCQRTLQKSEVVL